MYFFLIDWDKPFNLDIWLSGWRHLLIYAINSCPQLNRLSVTFSNAIIQEDQTNEFIETMKILLLWFGDEILTRIDSHVDIFLYIRFALWEAIYVI